MNAITDMHERLTQLDFALENLIIGRELTPILRKFYRLEVTMTRAELSSDTGLDALQRAERIIDEIKGKVG